MTNRIADLMTKNVISVYPETPLMEASQILFDRHLSGLPVVDQNKKLVGILTEYDLLTKGTQIHLPTFLKLLKEFDLYKKDQFLIKDELKKMFDLTVVDVMNKEPFFLWSSATIEETTAAFAEHHRVNPIPIVGEDNKLVGIVSRHDLIRLYAGDRTPSLRLVRGGRGLDARVDRFLKTFEDDFVMVSKFRTRFWFVFSLLFAIIGFVIAFALIVRVSFE